MELGGRCVVVGEPVGLLQWHDWFNLGIREMCHPQLHPVSPLGYISILIQ